MTESNHRIQVAHLELRCTDGGHTRHVLCLATPNDYKYEEQETCSKNFSNPFSSIARRCGTKLTPPSGLEPTTS